MLNEWGGGGDELGRGAEHADKSLGFFWVGRWVGRVMMGNRDLCGGNNFREENIGGRELE